MTEQSLPLKCLITLEELNPHLKLYGDLTHAEVKAEGEANPDRQSIYIRFEVDSWYVHAILLRLYNAMSEPEKKSVIEFNTDELKAAVLGKQKPDADINNRFERALQTLDDLGVLKRKGNRS